MWFYAMHQRSNCQVPAYSKFDSAQDTMGQRLDDDRRIHPTKKLKLKITKNKHFCASYNNAFLKKKQFQTLRVRDLIICNGLDPLPRIVRVSNAS
jgi:hypothetical protein